MNSATLRFWPSRSRPSWPCGRTGREEEAREVFGLIANAFKDNPDPQLATEADSMLEQLAVMDLQIDDEAE